MIVGGRPAAVVQAPAHPLLPGARFDVRVDVPYVDPSVRGAVLRFGYAYTYLDAGTWQCTDVGCPQARDVQGRRLDRPHVHGGGDPQWRTGWHEVAGHDLFGGPPAPVSRVVGLTVPPDAPPSTDTMLWWQVRAELDLAQARDTTQPAPLLVLSDPEARRPCQDESVSSSATTYAVGLDRATYRRGETVTGTVTVWPDKPVSTRGLSVRVVRRVVQRLATHTHEQDGPAVPITGAFDFVPGSPFQVPFQVPLPPDAAACCECDGFSLHWYVEVVVDVKRFFDSELRAPLTVV